MLECDCCLRTLPTGFVLSSAAFALRMYGAFLERQHLQNPQSLSGVLSRLSHTSQVETRLLVLKPKMLSPHAMTPTHVAVMVLLMCERHGSLVCQNIFERP